MTNILAHPLFSCLKFTIANKAAYNLAVLFRCTLFFIFLDFASANGRGVYYGAYRTYPTGDTLIELPYMSGGPVDANVKWIAECNDLEALVGIRDSDADFIKLETMWCKQVFSNKPPNTNASLYPYYERCLHRNASVQEFYCFDGTSYSFNTFMTALYDDDGTFSVNVDVPHKRAPGSAFKCCSLPDGYQLNYGECEFRYTHDEYWEYFDNKYFLVKCPEKYIMTGMGWIKNPYDEDKHWDWIQCCPYNYFSSNSAPQSPLLTGSPAPILSALQQQIQQQQQLASAASQMRYQAGGGARRPPPPPPPAVVDLVPSSAPVQQPVSAADTLRVLLQQQQQPVTGSIPQQQPKSNSVLFMRALTADVP